MAHETGGFCGGLFGCCSECGLKSLTDSPVLTPLPPGTMRPGSWRPLSVALCSSACGDSPAEARAAAAAAAAAARIALSPHSPGSPPLPWRRPVALAPRPDPSALTPAQRREPKRSSYVDTPDPRWLADGRCGRAANGQLGNGKAPGHDPETDYTHRSAAHNRTRPWQGTSYDD